MLKGLIRDSKILVAVVLRFPVVISLGPVVVRIFWASWIQALLLPAAPQPLAAPRLL